MGGSDISALHQELVIARPVGLSLHYIYAGTTLWSVLSMLSAADMQ